MESVSPVQPDVSNSESLKTHPKKRIVICCDGTWCDSDGTVNTPSNVTRICRSIPPVGFDHSTDPPTPVLQVTYYHNGVGTGVPSMYDKVIGGMTGEGMASAIREAYAYICMNYHPGDEIFLLGFSRGAFTARSISSLINAVGLLTPFGLKYLVHVFEDWEYQLKQGWTTRFPTEPWPHRPALSDPQYRDKLLELELTRPDIPVKCVAVWDTVGSLGIPAVGIFPQPPSKDFSFVDTKVENNIEYAFQALALDERRRSFSPTIWCRSEKERLPLVLKQTWFPGVHSDVGGSYPEDDLSDVTLAWMVGQIDAHKLLTFDHGYIYKAVRQSMEPKNDQHVRVRDWGLGKIHDSMTFLFRLGGALDRSPREYFELDPQSLESTGRRLENTNEKMHASVRIRMGREGMGFEDMGLYDPASLKGWTMHGDVETNSDNSGVSDSPGQAGKMKNVVWKKSVQPDKVGKAKGLKGEILEMPEDEFTPFERQILRLWPDMEKEFYSTRPGNHPTEIGKLQHVRTGFASSTPAKDANNPLHVDTHVEGANSLATA